MRSIEFLKKNNIDIDKSLDLFGTIDVYNNTLGSFPIGIKEKIKTLDKYRSQKDLYNYAIYAHSLKTDAKNFGFNDLADKAYEHEQKSKEGDLFFITEYFKELEEEVNKTIKLVKEYMYGEDEETTKEQPKKINPGMIYGKKTVLVVDDSNIIRNFVKKIFSEKYDIGTATDGEEAIEIIKANEQNDNICAILLDLNMPKVDGFAVLKYLDKEHLFSKMPVSIITGDSSKETIDKAFKYEIVDMLEKPFTIEEVRRVTEKTIMIKESLYM